MRQRAAILVLASVLFASSACNKSDLSIKSPSETVVALLMAMNEGKYPEVNTYLSSESLKSLEDIIREGHVRGGTAFAGVTMEQLLQRVWAEAWAEVTENGTKTVERIEVLREEVRDEEATVWFRVHFKDGSHREEEEIDLIKENGVWKIGG